MASTDFFVGKDQFTDLEISPTSSGQFYYFFSKRKRQLIKRFVLDDSLPEVIYLCEVALIEKHGKFTPRLSFAIKDRTGRQAKIQAKTNDDRVHLKASVSLRNCHAQFWQLIAYLTSLSQLEIPRGNFSLVSQAETEIVSAIRMRDPKSVKNIIKQLSSALTDDDVNEILKRKERLHEFAGGLVASNSEGWWQKFFKNNKWIFGYGLNYVILNLEESQPNIGGAQLNRRGSQFPDYIASTSGDVRFTVLVEIKTPGTSLLSGTDEIRSGAWSLSGDFTDAIAQIQANIDGWAERGSKLPENMDLLEKNDIFTVKPKGILVLGCLAEVKGVRHKLQTFERFRKSIHGVEIITFDELYERARFIVGHST